MGADSGRGAGLGRSVDLDEAGVVQTPHIG
jgi:hypothetical protein